MKMNKDKVKKKVDKKKKAEAVLCVAQEINFARVLAGNDERKRAKVLKTLKRWFTNRFENGQEFKQDDFTRIWKGLFYSMWMSDKPLVQEELCDSIANILDLFPTNKTKYAVMFFTCGLRIIGTEWYGIDQHRIDKFLMFVRRLMRGMLRCLKNTNWNIKSCRLLAASLCNDDGLLASSTPQYARNALGLLMHFVECYCEEIAKVSEGEIPEASLVELLKPLAKYMALGSETRLCACIKKSVFIYLIRQSPLGIQYDEKKRAWEKMGCPEGGVDAIVVEEDPDAESDPDEEYDERQSALDPRAGKVDVILPILPVPSKQIVDMLEEYSKDKNSRSVNRHRVKTCIKHYQELSEGKYPLSVPDLNLGPESERKLPSKEKVAKKLLDFEKKLTAESDELALRGLSRKKRKRVMAKIRNGEDVFESKKTEVSPKKKAKIVMNEKRDQPQKKVSKNNKKLLEAKNNNKTLNEKPIAKQVKVLESTKAEKITTSKVDKRRASVETLEPKKKPLEKIKKVEVKKRKIEEKSKVKKPLFNGVKKEKSLAEKKRDLKKKIQHSGVETVLRGKNMDKQNAVKLAPKKVTIALKNNSVQAPIDYYKSVRQSPGIPFDGTKKPSKTNLKPNSTPSPINPFFRKKLNLKF